jgi:hypothetical protein
MGIKEAIAEFRKAVDEPKRFDVYALGVHIGSATHLAASESFEEDQYTYLWNYYPRSPAGIIPIGDIVIDWENGLVYMFNGKEGDDVVVDMEYAVSLIEAITKEL